MDPPEEKKKNVVHSTHPSYKLGDLGKASDMADVLAHEDYYYHEIAVARLKPHDHCFVRRSGGRGFAYAKVLSHSEEEDEEAHISIVLQVLDDGSTKTIPLSECGRYIRLLRVGVQQQPHQGPQRCTRRCSETSSSSSPLFHRGFSARNLSTPDLQGAAAVNNNNNHKSRQQQQQRRRRASMTSSSRHDGNLSSSFQSRLNQVHLTSAYGGGSRRLSRRRSSQSSLRGSIHTIIPEEQQQDDAVACSRRSSIRSSTHSSTQRTSWSTSLHDPVDELLSDLDLSSSSEEEDEHEDSYSKSISTASSTNDHDDDDDVLSLFEFGNNTNSNKNMNTASTPSRCNSTPQDSIVVIQSKTSDDLSNNNSSKKKKKKVSLPGGFNDFQYDEDSLLKALCSITPRVA